jgi:hypothetical protein
VQRAGVGPVELRLLAGQDAAAQERRDPSAKAG